MLKPRLLLRTNTFGGSSTGPLNAANQCILDLLGKLSLASIYQKNPGELHTSSDGRKVSVVVESLNANKSFKYFGSGSGSSLYSFIDELNRLFYTTSISSSEREAAYVADGLLHNLSIKSTIHSTDTHGYSEAIFGILNMLGIYFAPRIKGLKKATLYSFNSRGTYETKGYKILPHRYIDTDLIKTHWDDILRLMVTIKLKATTASQLFKRLSSYSKQHPLYCAIKEFGRIINGVSQHVREVKDKLLQIINNHGGITQLSKLTHIPQPSLSRFFNTNAMPRRRTLLKITEALNLDEVQINIPWSLVKITRDKNQN